MYCNDYAGAVEKWKVDLIVSRAKRLGFRPEDLEDAQQQIVLTLLSFEFDAERSNGASERTVVTSIIDHQLLALLRARRRYENRVTNNDDIRGDDPSLAREWLAGYQLTMASDVKAAMSRLSPTARQVCALLADGLSFHQVAIRLGIGWHTVHVHVRNIRRCFERLDVDHRVTT
ncbi:MAG: helix-turn-helix transcriptional regulator [Pirellulaceae bacterium]